MRQWWSIFFSCYPRKEVICVCARARLENRFEDTVKAEFVDLSDFGLGSVPVRPTAEKPESQTAARPSTRQSGKEGKDQAPVTDDAALRAVRTLGTTKESARVEPCTKILHRALVHGNTEARSTACLPRSVEVRTHRDHLRTFVRTLACASAEMDRFQGVGVASGGEASSL